MTIYNNGPLSYIMITPIRARYTDDSDSVRLCAKIDDNLSSSCQIYWELQDSLGNRTIRGNGNISGDEYTTWPGDSEYVFNYLLTSLSLTELSIE